MQVTDYHPPATWSSDYQVLKSMIFADVKGSTQQVGILHIILYNLRLYISYRKDWRVFMFLKRICMTHIVIGCFMEDSL